MLDTVTELVAPKSISPALETCQIKAGSSQNCPNIEKSVIFTQELPKSVVSTRFNWAEDAAELPTLSTLSTASTKSPRDFSGLLSSSSSKNSFSSLHHRRRKFNKNGTHFYYSKPQYRGYYMFPGPYLHSEKLHSSYHSRRPSSVSLDWDQDPRLADLGNALRALSWVRR